MDLSNAASAHFFKSVLRVVDDGHVHASDKQNLFHYLMTLAVRPSIANMVLNSPLINSFMRLLKRGGSARAESLLTAVVELIGGWVEGKDVCMCVCGGG